MLAALLGAGAAFVAAPPELAAAKALTQCVAHATGGLAITAGNAAALAETNVAYQADPPPALRSMAHTAYGTAGFARSPSTEGDVWIVGYDRGTCMVMVLNTPVDPVERKLAALFAAPGNWRAEPVDQISPDARWTQYGSDADVVHLTAQMKVQPLPATPVKGLVMVTVSPELQKK